MKFDNWHEFLVVSGHNDVLGQGSHPKAAIEDALFKGNSPEVINAAMIHMTVARPKIAVSVEMRDANGCLILFGCDIKRTVGKRVRRQSSK